MAVLRSVVVLVACLAVALAGVSRSPTTPPTGDSGRLPADILCEVYGGAVCEEAKLGNATAHHRSRRQEQQGDDAGGATGDLDPATLCSVFGGENCPLDSSKSYREVSSVAVVEAKGK